jgi:hypothetical protein
MRGYLTVPDTDMGQLMVDSRVELYRDPDRSHRVCARREGEIHDLGVSDCTVSRRKKGTPPVVIEPRESYIEVHNRRNSNEVTIDCDDGRTKLTIGQTETVSDTAWIEVGHQTTFVMRVREEARINVEGSVGGDVVAGNQTNVDERTQVVDSVVNRSEIDGDGSGTVKDSVVNRSSISGDGSETAEDSIANRSQVCDADRRLDESDTKNHCERHDRMYASELCPECKAEQHSGGDPAETKFCLYCGIEILAAAAVCPDCGNELPEHS